MKPGKRKIGNWLYGFVFVVMAFTGFGEMPIYNRYYISDVPGMGWTSD